MQHSYVSTVIVWVTNKLTSSSMWSYSLWCHTIIYKYTNRSNLSLALYKIEFCLKPGKVKGDLDQLYLATSIPVGIKVTIYNYTLHTLPMMTWLWGSSYICTGFWKSTIYKICIMIIEICDQVYENRPSGRNITFEKSPFEIFSLP